MSELQLAIELDKERLRSTRYFERMKRDEISLASIRARLGVSHKSTFTTLQRIDDLQDMAVKWVQYTDSFVVKRFDQGGELND